MEAVKKALELDYEKWKINNKRRKRSTGSEEADLSEFLQEQFGFDDKADYNMMDIIQSMASPDVDASSGMNAARETLLACREEQTTGRVREKRRSAITFIKDATSGSVAVGFGINVASLATGSIFGTVGGSDEGGNCPSKSYFLKIKSRLILPTHLYEVKWNNYLPFSF